MKRFIMNNIIGFILGGIIFSSITAYATMNYQANQITYKNTTLDVALDDLYSSANIETYNVSGNITPTKSEQVFNVNGKKMNGNFVVNSIPSNYVDVGDSTISYPYDIAYGKTAYLSNGTKITGINKNNCVGKNITLTSEVTTSVGQEFVDYWPSEFFIQSVSAGDISYLFYFNEAITKTTIWRASLDSDGVASFITDYDVSNYKIQNGRLGLHDKSSLWIGRTLYVIACL